MARPNAVSSDIDCPRATPDDGYIVMTMCRPTISSTQEVSGRTMVKVGVGVSEIMGEDRSRRSSAK